jgi:hypothetical protein
MLNTRNGKDSLSLKTKTTKLAYTTLKPVHESLSKIPGVEMFTTSSSPFRLIIERVLFWVPIKISIRGTAGKLTGFNEMSAF